MVDRQASGRGKGWRRSVAFLISGLLTTQSFTPAWAGQFTIFQKTYTRGQGRPSSVTDDFSVLNANTPWTLDVTNGDPKVRSARVVLNGKILLGPRDFPPD